jgi:RNA polymerase sigma factor (sigma-70 family)
MTVHRRDTVLRHLCKVALRSAGSDLEDGRLLEQFVSRRDEAAFETLVRRHGPMVLGVCRRILGNHHDVEDAFQATFLVLLHKAASLVERQTIGNWLYGVAYHTALKARAALARRRAKESQVHLLHGPSALEEAARREWQALLDYELHRLPDKYRAAVVLCDLQGNTRKQAARQLGLPEGTLSTRLTRARALLGKRLARHAATFSAGAVGVLLAEHSAAACLSTPLVVATVRAARVLGTGQEAAAGAVRMISLMKGVRKDMFLMKIKVGLTVLLVTGIATLGGGLLMRGTAAADPAPARPEQRAAAAEEEAGPLQRQAPPPRTATRSSDRDQLQGVWKVVYAEKNGQPFHDETRYTFSGDSLLIRPRSDVAYPYTLGLSGDKGTITIGAGGEAQTGVYLLDAEVLVHRYAYDSFDDNEQRRRVDMLRVLRRDHTAVWPPRRTAAGEQQHAREEAVALLRTARDLLAQGKLDEAERVAVRVVRMGEIHWGLFEDNPDKVLRDVSRARQDNASTVRQHGSREDLALSRPRPAGGDSDVHEISAREMKIPVLVAAERRAGIKYLRLLVSANHGQSWETTATIAPDEDAFTFRAPADGLYWLTVQMVPLDSTKEASGPGQTLKPMLKISVKSRETRAH